MALLKIPFTLKEGYFEQERGETSKSFAPRLRLFFLTKGQPYPGMYNSTLDKFWDNVNNCGSDTILEKFFSEQVVKHDEKFFKNLQSELNIFFQEFVVFECPRLRENSLEIEAEILTSPDKRVQYILRFEFRKEWQLHEPEIVWL